MAGSYKYRKIYQDSLQLGKARQLVIRNAHGDTFYIDEVFVKINGQQ